MDDRMDASPNASPKSHSTSLTTPELSPGNADDVWASDSDHGQAEDSSARGRLDLLSDLPTVRRQHMNDGYREGLAVGKARVMQQGFDQGYPIGVAMALRAGKVVGILEGYVASKGIAGDKTRLAAIQKTLGQAKEELACTALLKDITDDTVAKAEDVPAHIEKVLRKWELLVLGE